MTPRPALPAALAETLRDPGLRGARCAGQPDLFVGARDGEDTAARAARHREALRRCDGCPASPACDRIVRSLAPRDRDGVWAGQVWASGTPAHHPAPADDPTAA